jgi:tetratricopeptide (TPR) repeat protein
VVKFRFSIALLLGLGSSLLNAQTSAPGKVGADLQQLLNKGALAVHQGRLAEAEGYFRQAIATAPQRPDGYLGLGMTELRAGDGAAAVGDLNKAIETSPETPSAHLFLGIALYQLNRYDAAAAALQQELKLQPDSAEVLTWLGMAQIAAGHAELATAPLDRAAQLAPQDANVLVYRGRAHTQVAQQCYQQLYALDPGSWQLHQAMAELFSAAQQHEQAIGEYKAALVQQPRNSDLYESLGFEYQKAGKYDEAVKAYQQVLELNPHDAVALFNLAKIRIEKDDAAGGIPLIKQAIAAHAAPAPSYYYLGYGLAAQGEFAEAAQWLERSLAEKPSDLIAQNAWYSLARVYQKLGRNGDSQHALEEFKKLKAVTAAKRDAL